MLNNQAPEPRRRADDGATLDVIEIFYTLQGEGPFVGHPAIFVRLAGCNLQCPLCDTEYTSGRHSMPLRDIIASVSTALVDHPNCDLVVLTGGEPMRQNVTPLICGLIDELGVIVQIESNGVLGLSDDLILRIAEDDPMLIYIVSPKTSGIHADTQYASAFKYVISADSIRAEDGLPLKALGHPATPFIARPPKGMTVYVNPCDEKDPILNDANIKAVVASSMKHGYVAGVQLHKLLDLP